MTARYSLDTVADFVSQEIGVTDWQAVEQATIDQFASATGDRQWIHVDVERCRRESPFGGPIAHGFLLLSLLAPMQMRLGLMPSGVSRAINAGLGEVKFQSPVLAGESVRLRVTLESIEPKGADRLLMVTSNVLEVQGKDKPALTASMAAMLYR
ncbi:maoC like domain protein [Lysobacter capsici]|uniref:MaoC family dehydratase n=1 Tax=Lysobacter capsici TaxID=435897 RepID=UPI000716470A|nr:MaoC family dehydratase [Lysobacter capsici]ALN83947.1 maoC like domain protein [Lysobacter capsici]